MFAVWLLIIVVAVMSAWLILIARARRHVSAIKLSQFRVARASVCEKTASCLSSDVSRCPPVAQPRHALPVIDQDELQRNLKWLRNKYAIPVKSFALYRDPLPFIDVDQVRAHVRMIHSKKRRDVDEERTLTPTAAVACSVVPTPTLANPAIELPPLANAPVVRAITEAEVSSVEPPVSSVVPLVVMPTPIPQSSLTSLLELPLSSEEPTVPLTEAEVPSVESPVSSVVPLLVVMPAPVPQRPLMSLLGLPLPSEEPIVPLPALPFTLASQEGASVKQQLDLAEFPPMHAAHLSLPPLALLRASPPSADVCSEEELLARGILIEEKLSEFKVKVSVLEAYAGPVITRFEVEPAVGVRGNQVVNLVKDLARALGLAAIRVVETIPGKTCMGLELPNPVRQMIYLADILSSLVFQHSPSELTLALGKDITGEPIVMDLARAPHLLVAGTTGSGKSVGVNAMILSVLYKAGPDKVRFIMIDPKMLELAVYNDIPHLLAPVVTDMKLAANALNWCVGEMERRYRLMSALGVRNLASYNEKICEAQARGQQLLDPFTVTQPPDLLTTLPFIVVVVDEFADLMMVSGKKIEELIARLAQKARAAGIHLILATQRPSVDVITGLIKANIPTRIAFQVSSKIDSRTILDQMGAEALLGQGDMLYLPPGTGYPQRVHGAFVADEEVHGVVEFLKQFGAPQYVEGLLTGEAGLNDEAAAGAHATPLADADPLYDEAVEIVVRTRKASISSVQRHLRIGYNRAARLIEEMEAVGIVSPMENNGNRTVLLPERHD